MKHSFRTIISALFRLTLAAVLCCVLAFSFAPAAVAEDGTFALGDCSDDVQRAQTRLSDLGYSTGVVDGRWDQADEDALSAFCETNGVSAAAACELLFSNDALAAASVGSSVFASGGAQGFMLTYGTLMSWDEVEAKLVPGQSYNVTSCYSGLMLHMVCVSLGSHAVMQPELDWDNATLRGFFSTASSSEKQPIVISIDGVLVAASIQQAAPVWEDAALPEYVVYFHDSLSDISGIPDAEHEAIVLLAANQQ